MGLQTEKGLWRSVFIMPTLGDPPAIGHEYRDACKSCGSTEGRAWTYGANDGKSKGFSTCRSCGAVTK